MVIEEELVLKVLVGKVGGYMIMDIGSYGCLGITDQITTGISMSIFIFTEKNKLCMLKWGHVHHIIPVKQGGLKHALEPTGDDK